MGSAGEYQWSKKKVSLLRREEIPAGHMNPQFIATHPGCRKVLGVTQCLSKQANHTSGIINQLESHTPLTVL